MCVCVFECDTTEYGKEGRRKGKEKTHKKRGRRKDKEKKKGVKGGRGTRYILNVTKMR